MRRQLIVNADDFARDPEVNRGILTSHNQGIVTTTTVLINMPGAVQAVHEVARSAPDLGIGLHLNLTLGFPCAPISDIGELAGEEGLFHKVDVWYENYQSIPIDQVEIEWRAQIDKFFSTGVRVDHLDSHHHIAVIKPDIWELFLDLAQELKCGVRPPYPDDVSNEALADLFPPRMLENARMKALPSLMQRSIPHPDSFLGGFFDAHANLAHLHKLLEQVPEGTSELMCHPGYMSENLETTSSYARQRVVELEALVHPSTIQMIKRLKIDLVTYQQVWPSF